MVVFGGAFWLFIGYFGKTAVISETTPVITAKTPVISGTTGGLFRYLLLFTDGGGFLKGGGVLPNHTHTNLLARVDFGNA